MSLGAVLKTEGEGTLVLIGRKGDHSSTALSFEVRSAPVLSSLKPAIQKDGRSIILVSPGERVTLNVAGGIPDLKVCTSQRTAADSSIQCVKKDFAFEAGEREGSVQVWVRDGADRDSGSLEFQITRRAGDLSYGFGDQGHILLSAPEGRIPRDTTPFTVAPDQKSLFITSTVSTPNIEASMFRIEKRDERGALVKGYGTEGIASVEGPFRSPAKSVTVDSKGRLLLVVERRNAPSTPQTFALMRLTSEGALDKTFAQEGIWNLPDAWEFTDVALRTISGDRPLLAYTIVQASGVARSEFHTKLTRLDELGQPDPFFGKDGQVILKLNLDTQQSLTVDEGRGLIHVSGFQYLPQDSPLRPRKNSVAAYARLRLDTGAPDADFGREGLLTIDVDYQPCCDVPDFQRQTALFYTPNGDLALALALLRFGLDLRRDRQHWPRVQIIDQFADHLTGRRTEYAVRIASIFPDVVIELCWKRRATIEFASQRGKIQHVEQAAGQVVHNDGIGQFRHRRQRICHREERCNEFGISRAGMALFMCRDEHRYAAFEIVGERRIIRDDLLAKPVALLGKRGIDDPLINARGVLRRGHLKSGEHDDQPLVRLDTHAIVRQICDRGVVLPERSRGER